MPSVSPDGTTVAFLGYDDSSTYPQNDARRRACPSTGATHRFVSAALDRTFETDGRLRARRCG